MGSDTVTVEVSALKKIGISDLLEMILLVSDMRISRPMTGRPRDRDQASDRAGSVPFSSRTAR